MAIEKVSLTLDQYPSVPHLNLLNVSPFCLKVEVYLRLRGFDFQTRTFFNPWRSRTGRFPRLWVQEKEVTDSFQILQLLEGKFPSGALDRSLDAQQLRQSFLLQRIFDLDFYRILLFHRWIDETGFSSLQKHFMPLFPKGTGRVALPILRTAIRSEARELGILDWSQAEIFRHGREILNHVANAFSSEPFLFGKKPCTVDCVAYSFLSSLEKVPAQSSEFYDALLGQERLLRFLRDFESALLECDAPRIHRDLA